MAAVLQLSKKQNPQRGKFGFMVQNKAVRGTTAPLRLPWQQWKTAHETMKLEALNITTHKPARKLYQDQKLLMITARRKIRTVRQTTWAYILEMRKENSK